MLASRHRAVFAAVLCVVAFITGPANAKRTVPHAVEPLTVHGVSYSAPATAMGFVVASDALSGRELWRQRIYRISVNPSLERDVQDVFITSLTLRGGSLVIANEHGERYALDLSTRKVTRESDRHT
jgi:outer membrane protein assembly factor BamB